MEIKTWRCFLVTELEISFLPIFLKMQLSKASNIMWYLLLYQEWIICLKQDWYHFCFWNKLDHFKIIYICSKKTSQQDMYIYRVKKLHARVHIMELTWKTSRKSELNLFLETGKMKSVEKWQNEVYIIPEFLTNTFVTYRSFNSKWQPKPNIIINFIV